VHALERDRFVFRGFQPQSFSDYRGKIAAVLFTGGCNLRCRFCYNTPLVLNPEDQPPIVPEEAIEILKPRLGFIQAVVISGGEPTVHDGLLDFLRRLRPLGLLVGLDSNGTNPGMLCRILGEGLVDRLAIDYKAPRAAYETVTGWADTAGAVQETLGVVARAMGIESEVRVTLHPVLHTKDDITTMAQELARAGVGRVAIQSFKPWNVLDRRLLDVPSYSSEELAAFARAFQGEVVVR
jgi:pyruvate formate lyase activating enzyme